MRHADKLTTDELLEKAWVALSVQIGLFLALVAVWAATPSGIALALSLALVLLVNLLLRIFLSLSNMVLNSRVIAYQDSIVAMIHAHILNGQIDGMSVGERPIDEATLLAEERYAEAERLYGQPEQSTLFGLIGQQAAQIALFLLAAAIGIYFSPEIMLAAEQAADLVGILR